MRFIASMLFAVLFPLTMGWEACESDCKDEYDEEVKSCETFYDARNDSDYLKLCIENAKADRDSCLHKCDK